MKTITLDTNVVLAKQILNLDFNADGKLLMVQCGEPDYTLLIYRWFAGKVCRSPHALFVSSLPSQFEPKLMPQTNGICFCSCSYCF